MAAMTMLCEEDAKLASQCLEICKTLAGKSLPFSFSVNIGPNFSFSVDTRGVEEEVLATRKKKKTPSTLRRDARRREEYLRKKLNLENELWIKILKSNKPGSSRFSLSAVKLSTSF